MPYNAEKTFESFSKIYIVERENEYNNLDQLEYIKSKMYPLTGKKLLELGCGSGVPVLQFFNEAGATVSGIDLSHNMIEAAKHNIPAGNFTQANITQYSLNDESYDIIIAFYSLFHLPLKDQFSTFEKIFHALKSGGMTYFTLLSKAHTQQDEFSGILNFMDHDIFYAHTTPEKYQQQLEKIGFKGVTLEEKTIGHEVCLWVSANKQ